MKAIRVMSKLIIDACPTPPTKYYIISTSFLGPDFFFPVLNKLFFLYKKKVLAPTTVE